MNETLPTLSLVTDPYKAPKGSYRGEFTTPDDKGTGLAVIAVEGGFAIVRREDFSCRILEISEVFEGKAFRKTGSLFHMNKWHNRYTLK